MNVNLPSLPTLPLTLCAALAVVAPAAHATADARQSASPEASVAEESDFNRRWVLNEELSDDPREKMREAMGSGGGRGGGGPRGGGGGRGRAGQGSRRGGGGPGEAGAGPGGELGGAAELVIVRDGDRFVVRHVDGRERSLRLDGAAVEGIGGVMVRARADGDAVVIESRRDQGPSTTERYELTQDGPRLVLTTEIQMPRGDRTVTIRRVYDAMEP